MKKTYTYNELKGFINEELQNFNHIIESKHIFNAEFNKYRKFFKCITKKVSYVPIIANKQVLEVQVVSQELSAAVHKAWRRK